MATALQDFRAKYPEYNHVDDEELAEALYQKYYSSDRESKLRSALLGSVDVAANPDQFDFQGHWGESQPGEGGRPTVYINHQKYADAGVSGYEDDAILGESLHNLKNVDPARYGRIRDAALGSPEYMAWAEESYRRAQADPEHPEERPFDQWHDVSRLDQVIGGYLQAGNPNLPSMANWSRTDLPYGQALKSELAQLATAIEGRPTQYIERVRYRRLLGLPIEKPYTAPTMADRVDSKISETARQEDPFKATSDRMVEDMMALARDFDGPLQTYFRDWEQAQNRGFLNNTTRLAAERASSLLGHALQGLSRIGEAGNEKFAGGQIVFGSDWGPDDPADGKFRVRYMRPKEFEEFAEARESRNILTDIVPGYLTSRDFGGVERHTTQRVKDAYARGEILGTAGAVLKFGIEQGLRSVPDMIAVLGGPASLAMYINARSNEIGNVRAANKALEEGSLKENIEALPWAIGSALLERVGAGKIVSAFGRKSAEQVGQELLEAGLKAAAKRVAGKTLTAAGYETGTEAFQEGVLEYLGEKLGTDAPLTWAEAVERGFFGALGGATFGGIAGGTLALGGEAMTTADMRMIREMERQAEPALEPETPAPDTDFDADGNVIEVPPEDAGPAIVPDPEPEPDVPHETPPDDSTTTTAQAEIFDPRLKRDVYRVNLAGMADELVVGGGITLVLDPESDTEFIGRTPSVNPGWFQGLRGTEAQMSVKQVQNAVRKALNGEALGVRQARVVGIMLDEVTGARTEQPNIDHAKEQLDAARLTRARARAGAAATLDEAIEELDPYEAEHAGELFEEGEYLPEMDAEARIVDELAAKLDDFGETVSERVAIILDGSNSTAEAMEALEVLLHEQLSIAPGAAGAELAEGAEARAAVEAEAVPEFELEREQEGVIPPPPPAAPPEYVAPDLGIAGDLFSEDANRQVDIDDLIREGELVETDNLTGLGNQRAFEAMLPHAAAVGAVEVDSLSGINDNISQIAGDALIRAVALALQNTGAEVYRTGDDQFHILGDHPGQIASQITDAELELAHQVIEDPAGKVVGINITSGVAETKAQADSIMEGWKKEREAAGLRAPKGILPKNGVVYVGTVLNATAGSNHVGNIGRHGELPLNPDREYVLGNGDVVQIPAKPVRRRHIMAVLERKFGVRIFQGRVKGKTRLGFYRPGHGEIRIKNANDLEVTAHEVSHWLDDRHPWISQLYNKYRDEILKVSYDVKKDYEGYAEFMRTWFTQEHQARESAPGFYDAWMEALESHPGIKSVVMELQQLMHGWHLQGARARLDDRYGKRDVSITDRAREILDQWQDRLLQKIFDGLRPFKEIERQIRGEVGAAAWSGYKSLRLARGANGVMQGIFNRGTVNWNEDGDLVFTGSGLKQIFEPVSDRMENQLAYLVAKRAAELTEQGRENHIRPDEIQAGLELGRADPELEAVASELQAFNDRMMDFYQASGLLSATSRAAIQEMNKDYVPFNRIMDAASGDRVKRGGGSPFMRLKGGTQDIADIMESIVANTAHLVHMSLVNRGKQNFYQMIDNADNQTAGLYAAPIGKDAKPTKIQKDQVIKTVVEGLGLNMRWYRMAKTGVVSSHEEMTLIATLDTMAAGLEPMITFWQTGQDPKGQVDFYFKNGEKKFYEIIDERLLEAIQQIGPQSHNLAVNILGGFANVLRRGVVLTPTFQAKNFIRDTMNAFTLSKGEIVPAASATKALLERIYNDQHYWEYMINGGGFASMADADGINRDRVLDTEKKIWDHLDSALAAFEYANRIAEFKTLKAKGWSAREAALAGREISTDFAMRGSSEALRVITISVPFLNARMQGLYRNARELASMEQGRLTFAGKQAFSYALRSLIAITIPTLVLYALNKDDERYQELPDWVRDLGWIMFTGEGEDDYVIIPKPFETGMLWGTLPERMLDYYYQRDEAELADAMLWMILETFNMNPIPQAFKPWQELANNRNFTGAPIVPEYLENVEPSEQYRAYTSDAMIALGRKLNISPLKAEHIVRGHFGTLGSWALGLADMLVGDIANGGKEPTKTWRSNILMAPFVNDGPLRRTHSENHLYEMLRETQRVANTVRIIANRSPQRLEQYIGQPRQEILSTLNEGLVTWSQDMRALKNAIDAVQVAPDMDGDEKRRQINELERAQNQISREVYQNINPELVQELLEDAENAVVRARAAGEN